MKNFRFIGYICNVADNNKHILEEIWAVLLTGLLKFILMDWLNLRAFYITIAIVFWAVFIYKRYRENPEVMDRWGIRRKNFIVSMLVLLPFGVLGTLAIIIYGFFNDVSFFNWHILPILLFYPLWGTFQQFIVAGLVARNLRYEVDTRLNDFRIIIAVSLLFALIHIPYWPLAVYVFVMEIIFLLVYFHWRNIWALGIYHGLVSTFFLYFVSGRDLFKELYAIFI